MARRAAGEMLEIFAEKRLVGKVEQRTDFLYLEACGAQQEFGFLYHSLIDPLARSVSVDIFQDRRQMYRCHKELVGIKCHGPLLSEINLEKFEKRVEQFLTSSIGRVKIGARGIDRERLEKQHLAERHQRQRMKRLGRRCQMITQQVMYH